MKPLAFSHSGKAGDLLYSLTLVRALMEKTGQTSVAFHIQTNVPHMFKGLGETDDVMMTPKAADFLRPLLAAQKRIHSDCRRLRSRWIL